MTRVDWSGAPRNAGAPIFRPLYHFRPFRPPGSRFGDESSVGPCAAVWGCRFEKTVEKWFVKTAARRARYFPARVKISVFLAHAAEDDGGRGHQVLLAAGSGSGPRRTAWLTRSGRPSGPAPSCLGARIVEAGPLREVEPRSVPTLPYARYRHGAR